MFVLSCRLILLSIVASGLVHTVAGVRMSFLLRTERRVERLRFAYPCVHQGAVSRFGCCERGWNTFPLEPLRPGTPAGVPSTTRRPWMRDGAGLGLGLGFLTLTLWGWSRGPMRGRGPWKAVFPVAHPVSVASHLLCLPRKLEPGAPGCGKPPIRSPGGGGVVLWA